MENKVLHVISSLNDGGAEGVLCRLILADKSNSHSVILLGSGGKYAKILKEKGIEIFELNICSIKTMLFPFINMLKIIRMQSPDIVQTWMYHADLLGGVAARLVGVRNVYWGIRHSNLTKDTVKGRTFIIAKMCAFLSRFIPEKIICCSSNAAIYHKLIGYTSSKFVIIPNGYFTMKFDSSRNHSKRCKEKFLLSNTKPVIGMVARYNPQKDHVNLFEALAKLSNN